MKGDEFPLSSSSTDLKTWRLKPRFLFLTLAFTICLDVACTKTGVRVYEKNIISHVLYDSAWGNG
jgi:hypothetical protein